MERIFLLVITLLTFLFSTANASTTYADQKAETVNANAETQGVLELLAEYNAEIPGVCVGVIKNGRLTIEESFGLADLNYDIALTPATKMNLGSVGKQFTAFAILLLQQRGQLNIDAPIQNYLPELKKFKHQVTSRHLLTHTSGLRDHFHLLELSGRQPEKGDYIDRQEIIDIVNRQPKLQNEPGSEYNYNNTGYTLLAMIVERVTNTSFPAWMKKNVFEPLQMHNTVVLSESTAVAENMALGYKLTDENTYLNVSNLSGSMGAGGVYSTVGDMAKWVRNLRTGELGGEKLIKQMMTPHRLNSGEISQYGNGLKIISYKGEKLIYHDGTDVANQAFMGYFPEANSAIILMSNNSGFDVAGTFHSLVNIYFENEPQQEVIASQEETPVATSFIELTDIDQFTGLYKLGGNSNTELIVWSQNESLFMKERSGVERKLTPISHDQFIVKETGLRIRFNNLEDGKFADLTLLNSAELTAKRLDSWQPSEELRTELTGVYFSEELNTVYKLRFENDNLWLLHPRFIGGIKLMPIEKNTFLATSPISEVKVVTDDSGDVQHLSVAKLPRTRDVLFRKVDFAQGRD